MKEISKYLVVPVLLGSTSTVTVAALSPTATLNFDAPIIESGLVVGGSNFGVDFDFDGVISLPERTGLVSNDGVRLGVVQPGSVTTPGIDQPWNLFGNQGVHQTTSPVTIINDDGAGHVLLDFSGWTVTWNGIDVGFGGAAWGSNPDGVAVLTCGVDCSVGDAFSLYYTATVTDGPFLGSRYRLGLDTGAVSATPSGLLTALAELPPEDPGLITTGIIGESVVPIPPTVWLFGSGLLGLIGISKRKRLNKDQGIMEERL
jgi:hypothetical protein